MSVGIPKSSCASRPADLYTLIPNGQATTKTCSVNSIWNAIRLNKLELLGRMQIERLPKLSLLRPDKVHVSRVCLLDTLMLLMPLHTHIMQAGTLSLEHCRADFSTNPSDCGPLL